LLDRISSLESQVEHLTIKNEYYENIINNGVNTSYQNVKYVDHDENEPVEDLKSILVAPSCSPSISKDNNVNSVKDHTGKIDGLPITIDSNNASNMFPNPPIFVYNTSVLSIKVI
jgi:phage terminase large subunit